MRIPSGLAVLALLSTTAVPALASFSGKPDTPAPSSTSSSTSPTSPNGSTLTSRQQAEQWYGDAYDDITKAKKGTADGKAKAAEKSYRRAIERAQRAVEYDSTYHEAWNLIGFASRKLGDYPKSLAAYRTALKIAPDYAPAREYYGEALLETGDWNGAREQLAWLQKQGVDQAKELETAIDAWQKAHPEPAKSEGASGGGH